MTTHYSITFLTIGLAAALILGGGFGCISAGDRPLPLVAASTATGVRDALVFQSRGGPVDTSVPDLAVLTLPDAVRRALGTDPDIQAALNRVRAAEADVDQAGLLPNPILNVVFRFPENSGKPIVDVGLAADFVSLLTRPGRFSAADKRLRAVSAEVVVVALDRLAEVQERYAEIQSINALMPVFEQRRVLITRLVALAQARLDNGEGTRLDITTLDTQRLALAVEVAEKRLDLRRARLAMARQMGQPSSSAIWEVSGWEDPVRVSTDEQAWVAAALTARPEVESQRWELAALGVDYRLTRFFLLEGAGVGVTSERDVVWSVGPAVLAPLPLVDWGQARRAKADALVGEASQKYTKIRRQVVEEVRREYASFFSSMETTALVRDELLPAQERRRSQTEAAYRAGQTDVTTLILADQDLQASRAKLIELQQKTSAALYRLQRAVGGPGAAVHLGGEARSTTRPTTIPTQPSGSPR